ncbi:TnsD family Tn7-like transposition protein [Paenibacillus sp. GCM10023248]|uniref:TnsD family Tn7-like transposition protein n=1 Tax=unclassified Paenibacillus TaxID=185978 RepID=UPI002379C63F|nr:TnsD family Tn7-like transposition protein [Paenibacillus sp. MAHUQ-63]MDD9267874.1 TnsD family Tn7-like transposition protein [Paenibacillus sp. MAHUQ-63]
MISCFPTPYDEELLYSILSRYHVYSGNRSEYRSLYELFGSTTTKATIAFQSQLGSLVSKLIPFNCKISGEDLISKHTLFPLFQPFLDESRVNQIKNNMINSSGTGLYSQIGLSQGGIALDYSLRYCTECLREEILTLGEAYWHRIHQVPGVYVCPSHYTVLMKTETKLLNKFRLISPTADLLEQASTPLIYGMDEKTKLELQELAKDALHLLQQNLMPKGKNYYKGVYTMLLKLKGFTYAAGLLSLATVIQDFKNRYSETTLALLKSEVISHKEGWLIDFLRYGQIHPMRNILMMRYLAGSVDSFLKLPENLIPLYQQNNHKRQAKQKSNKVNKIDDYLTEQIWRGRDKRLNNEIQSVIQNWNDDLKPVMICISSIEKRLGKRFSKALTKLPITNEYLSLILETREAFQIRRVKWAISKLKENDERVTVKKVQARASLSARRHFKISENVTKIIEELVRNEVGIT